MFNIPSFSSKVSKSKWMNSYRLLLILPRQVNLNKKLFISLAFSPVVNRRDNGKEKLLSLMDNYRNYKRGFDFNFDLSFDFSTLARCVY